MRLTPNSYPNTGIVPPHILEQLEKGTVKEGGVPVDGSDCFPQVPTTKDPSGIDVIFTDVTLPSSKRAEKSVNLLGFGPNCFPHLPSSSDPSGLQIVVTGVELPN